MAYHSGTGHGVYEHEDIDFGDFPHPRDFRGKGVRKNPEIFSSALWFDVWGIHEPPLLEAYSDRSGWLPGNIHLQAVLSFDWSTRLVIHPLVKKRPENSTDSRTKWMRLIYRRIRRTPCTRLVPKAYNLDTWAFRTLGEVGYVDNLVPLRDNSAWRISDPP